VMEESGMVDMHKEMPVRESAIPIMTRSGPFGPPERGGLFTVVKVRDGLTRNDCRDPGWYVHPPGTVGYEWTGAPPAVQRPATQPASVPVKDIRKLAGTDTRNH
jgi:hypothetical protein